MQAAAVALLAGILGTAAVNSRALLPAQCFTPKAAQAQREFSCPVQEPPAPKAAVPVTPAGTAGRTSALAVTFRKD